MSAEKDQAVRSALHRKHRAVIERALRSSDALDGALLALDWEMALFNDM